MGVLITDHTSEEAMKKEFFPKSFLALALSVIALPVVIAFYPSQAKVAAQTVAMRLPDPAPCQRRAGLDRGRQGGPPAARSA